MGKSSFGRREFLTAGAAALAGCASAGGPPAPADSAAADAAFRDLVDRLGDRPRASRPFLLRRFDSAPLSGEGRILYDALLPGAEADAGLSRFAWGASGQPYPVTPRNGAWRRAGEFRADDEQSIIVREVNRDTAWLEGHAERGVIAPDFVIDAVTPLVEAVREGALARGDGYAPLAEALSRQIGALGDLRARATPDAGVWRLPDGERYYALALQFQLGGRVDPREAHARALLRCRELQAETDILLRAQGLVRGSVAERLRSLSAERRYLADTEAKKARAVGDMNARLAAIRARLSGVIDGAANLNAEIARLDPALEANGAQGRREGSTYFVDLGAPRPSWTLASVAHHEALPGHILQASYERAAGAAQLQTRYAGAYGEGWAIYAEQLTDELGAFDADPLSRIGYLQWLLFRMARVVADTGIHVMRWSAARAIEEMRALQGEAIAFVSIEEDVLRFCVQPGVYAAQGLAALDLVALRAETRRSAGDGFSLPRFHDAMLRHGPLSPPGLAQAARTAFQLEEKRRRRRGRRL